MQIKQEDIFDFMYMLFKWDSYKAGIFRQAYQQKWGFLRFCCIAMKFYKCSDEMVSIL